MFISIIEIWWLASGFYEYSKGLVHFEKGSNSSMCIIRHVVVSDIRF